MSRRAVTRDERALWRETTRRDKKFRAESEDPPEGASSKNKEAARPVKISPTPAASGNPKKPLTAKPHVLDARAAKKSLKNYALDATLDLHGMGRTEAHAAVVRLLATAKSRGWRHVLVITGKGRGGEEGVLKRALPGWLEERAEVLAMAPAAREKGGSGALHVLLRKPR